MFSSGFPTKPMEMKKKPNQEKKKPHSHHQLLKQELEVNMMRGARTKIKQLKFIFSLHLQLS